MGMVEKYRKIRIARRHIRIYSDGMISGESAELVLFIVGCSSACFRYCIGFIIGGCYIQPARAAALLLQRWGRPHGGGNLFSGEGFDISEIVA